MYSVEPLEIPKRPRSRKESLDNVKQLSKNSKFKSKAEIAKVFKDFCESTSLHGYSYLYIASSICMKIIWIIIILLMTALGIGFVVSNTKEYLNANIVTTIETSTAPLDVSTL